MQARQAKETEVLALGGEAPGHRVHRMVKYPKDTQSMDGAAPHSIVAGCHTGVSGSQAPVLPSIRFETSRITLAI